MKYFRNNLKKTAFSLIELSIVLLIIGIIIAGITQSSRLIGQFRLSTARSMTNSAPVNSIPGLTHWYETTAEESFDEEETEDRALDPDSQGVSVWYDINQIDGIKKNAIMPTLDSQPAYFADCMRDLPCVRFDGVDDFMNFNADGIVGNNYTIFAVVQRRIAAANYFIGDQSSTAANSSLSFGYSGTATFIIAQGDVANANSVTVPNFSIPTPEIHTIVNRSNTAEVGQEPILHFLNGGRNNDGTITPSVLATVGTPNLLALTQYLTPTIGRNGILYFNGDIGEIIIYNRSLKSEERRSVERYLIDKWNLD